MNDVPIEISSFKPSITNGMSSTRTLNNNLTAPSSGNNSVVMLDSANRSACNVTNNMVTNNIVINNPPGNATNDYGKSTACTSNYYDYGHKKTSIPEYIDYGK